MSSPWDEVVDISGVSIIAGDLNGQTTTLTELRSEGSPAVLRAFADDDDLNEIQVVSSCIGFVRKYTKRFKQ